MQTISFALLLYVDRNQIKVEYNKTYIIVIPLLLSLIAKRICYLSILRLDEVDMAGCKLWFDINSHPIKIDLSVDRDLIIGFPPLWMDS